MVERVFAFAACRHTPLIQHNDMIGVVHRQSKIVEDQHNSRPRLRRATQMAQQRELMRKIKRGERFIRQYPLRLTRQHPRQQHPCCFPAGKRLCATIGQMRNVQRRHRGIDRLSPCIAMRHPAQRDQAVDRHIPCHLRSLRQVTDPPALFA